ncbi:MAG: hypothetical protein WCR02_05970, partial [Sphaerochaetaceae bacterium]
DNNSTLTGNEQQSYCCKKRNSKQTLFHQSTPRYPYIYHIQSPFCNLQGLGKMQRNPRFIS